MTETVIKRYGNDVLVSAPIVDEQGAAFTPGGTMKVEMRNPHAKTIAIPDFSFSGNTITFWVLSDEIKTIGSYDLVIESKRADSSIRGGVRTRTVDVRGVIKIEAHTR